MLEDNVTCFLVSRAVTDRLLVIVGQVLGNLIDDFVLARWRKSEIGQTFSDLVFKLGFAKQLAKQIYEGLKGEKVVDSSA